MSDRRKNVMIVSSSERYAKKLAEAFDDELRYTLISALDAAQAKNIMFKSKIDVVFIDDPLKDVCGIKLAINLLEIRDVCIAILVDENCYEKTTLKVEALGIMTIAKPAERRILTQAMGMLLAMSEKLSKLEHGMSWEPKIEEARIINRAKRLLIDRLKMSEAQAHRYIEKTAMDSCVKKREIAENIIRVYES